MTTSRQRVEDIFWIASEIDSGEARDAYLQNACGEDAELRQRVNELLQAQAQAEDYLEQPAAVIATACLPTHVVEPVTVVGSYKLREQIGEGGFGVVYVAEQTKPIRRKVALKIIKPGMDSKEIIARFEAERQALALMDHPNIAKVLEAGMTGEPAAHQAAAGNEDAAATPTGRPYFVMELVRGVPITEFCDREKLTTEERLRLFTDVCRAVQHAHQKGIIHRDLKPTNVLVTLHDGKPIPKVIDFGVAKALSQQLTEHTLYTAMGQMVGTPLYMSPEQAEMSGLDVDTRSDVYSLGVLLYELLTSSTPFDKQTLKEAGLEGMRRIIRETEPVKPSARISTFEGDQGSTISDKRRVDARRLEQALRGELDWVVMKALEKDRNRRYESASAFATDVEHFLNDEPVTASPPSALYRFRKYARRNRQAVIASAGFVVIALVIVGALGWMARHRAVQQAVLQSQVEAALLEVDNLLAEGHPRAALSAVETASDIVAQQAVGPALLAMVNATHNDIRLVLKLEQIRLEQPVGNSIAGSRSVAQYERAFAEFGIPLDPPDYGRLAAAIRARPESVRRALLSALSDYLLLIRQRSQLWIIFEDLSFRISRIRAGSPAADSPLRVGDRVIGVGTSVDDVVATHEMTRREFFTQLCGNTAPEVVLEVTSGAPPERKMVSFSRPADWRKFLNVLRAVDNSAWRRKLWDAIEQDDNETLVHLAQSGDLRSQPASSLALLSRHVDSTTAVRILEDAQRRFPNDFWINQLLAVSFGEQSDTNNAIRFASVAVALRPDSSGAHNRLGVFLADSGDARAACAEYRQAIELNPDYAVPYSNLGFALAKLGEFDESLICCRKAVELDPGYGNGHANLGYAFMVSGDLPGAIDAFRVVVRLDPDDVVSHRSLAHVLERNGDLQEAIDCWISALSGEVEPGLDIHDAKLHLASLLLRTEQLEHETNLWSSAVETYVDGIKGVGFSQADLAAESCMRLAHDEQLFHEVTQLMPNHFRPWAARGRALANDEQWERAAADYATALRLINDTQKSEWWNAGGSVAMRIAQLPEVFSRVRSLRPNDDRLNVALVREYVAAGQFESAADELAGVVKRNPDDFWGRYFQAHLQAAVGDAEGYQQSCDELLARTNTHHQRIMTSRACLLLQDRSDNRLEKTQSLLDATDPPSGWTGLFNIAAGLLAYRRGEFSAARDKVPLRSHPLVERQAISDILAAMVDYRDGQIEKARDLYHSAVTAMETERMTGDQTRRRMELDQWLMYEIVRREAAQLMQIKEASQPLAIDSEYASGKHANNQ